jgi:hypothetical protein
MTGKREKGKGKIFFVMLAILLVFGMLVSCGEDPVEDDGPDLEDEATYFGTYATTYTQNGVTYVETIVFDETYFKISDDTKKTDGTLAGDHLTFAIKDWDKDVETPASYSSKYPYAFKFIGTITEASPIKNDAPTNIYGTQTAPGLAQSDITSATPLYMLLYFDYQDGEITFVRTRFNKVTGGSTENETVVLWAGTDATTKDNDRVYKKVN